MPPGEAERGAVTSPSAHLCGVPWGGEREGEGRGEGTRWYGASRGTRKVGATTATWAAAGVVAGSIPVAWVAYLG